MKPGARQGGERPSDLTLALCVALPAFLSRLPFLLPGYGLDADAWRVAYSGWHLGTRGVYFPSRDPGFPVQELAAAVLYRGGPLLLNGTTALFGAAAAACFALVLRRALQLGPWLCWLAGLALASVPVVYVESTTAMDYVWALAGLTASAYALTRERRVLAGVLLGLAIGCRVTTAGCALPLAVLAAASAPPGRRARDVLALLAPAAAVGLLAYSLVLAQERWSFDVARFLRYQSARVADFPPPPWRITLRRATLEVWGALGGVALALAALALALPRVRRAGFAASARTPLALASLVALPLGAALFLRLPHEAAYLIPSVPFVLWLQAALLRPRAFACLCLALLPAAWIDWGEGAPRAGALVRDQRARRDDVRFTQRCLDGLRALERPAKVVTGRWYMKLEQQALGRAIGRAEIVMNVRDATQVEVYRQRGFALYYLPGADEDNRLHAAFDLGAHGFAPLFLPQPPAR
jgi:hypothetical protein